MKTEGNQEHWIWILILGISIFITSMNNMYLMLTIISYALLLMLTIKNSQLPKIRSCANE